MFLVVYYPLVEPIVLIWIMGNKLELSIIEALTNALSLVKSLEAINVFD